MQQHVIHRLGALLRGGDRDLQVFANAILADVFVEPPRTQSGFVLRVFVDACRGDQTIVAHHPLSYGPTDVSARGGHAGPPLP